MLKKLARKLKPVELSVILDDNIKKQTKNIILSSSYGKTIVNNTDNLVINLPIIIENDVHFINKKSIQFRNSLTNLGTFTNGKKIKELDPSYEADVLIKSYFRNVGDFNNNGNITIDHHVTFTNTISGHIINNGLVYSESPIINQGRIINCRKIINIAPIKNQPGSDNLYGDIGIVYNTENAVLEHPDNIIDNL